MIVRAVPIDEETRDDLALFADKIVKAFPINAGMLRKIAREWDDSPEVPDEEDA